ncbi:MAG: hypothetical protein JOZ08_08740 [Verrucomicrobia bacterium]|nr:hypothetical protein [Verrucomicrobiota bacterium]MBV8276827.1 hypothetical protein [Verrucomicrobiota bacterium]
MALSIAAVVAVILVVITAQQISNAVRTNEGHNSVIGSPYIGDWQEANNSANFIKILPNGSASCQIVNGSTHYTVTAGQATFDKQTKRLAIKFFFVGPSWHVDEAPHQTADGVVMKLDGQTFLKLRTYSSPSGSGSPGVSI